DLGAEPPIEAGENAAAHLAQHKLGAPAIARRDGCGRQHDIGIEATAAQRVAHLALLPRRLEVGREMLHRAAAAIVEMRARRLYAVGPCLAKLQTLRRHALLYRLQQAHADTIARRRVGHEDEALRRFGYAIAVAAEADDLNLLGEAARQSETPCCP